MSGKPIAQLIRDRWDSSWPHVGSATETLRHKLRSGALDELHKQMVLRELVQRGEKQGG